MSIGAKEMCAVCAWRRNCKNKFKVSAGKAHCPDFIRDVQLKADDEQKPFSKAELKS